MINSTQVYELVSSIVLDAEIASVATADAISVATSASVSASQTLSIARAEAWRQLRARSIFPLDVPLFAVDGDPVAALSPAERTVLALSLRLKRSDEEVAEISGIQRKELQGLLKEARRQLARAAIAMTMLTNDTRCPVTSQAQQTLGATLKRSQAMNLVSHAAECSICVPVLRTVDRQIIADYINAAPMSMPTSIDDRIASYSDAERSTLLSRAGLKTGWAPPDTNLNQDPRRLLKRAALLGAISALCIVVGLIVAAR